VLGGYLNFLFYNLWFWFFKRFGNQRTSGSSFLECFQNQRTLQIQLFGNFQESKNLWFQVFKNPQRTGGFHETTSKEPAVLLKII
jgi:hypothetical protein